MNELLYSEIQDFLNQSDVRELPGLNIVVLRNITLEPIEPYLLYCAQKLGFKAKVTFGEYDNIFQEAVGGQKDVVHPDVDFIFVFATLEMVSPELALHYTSLSAEQVAAETERIREYVQHVLSGIRRQTNAVILWHGFEWRPHPALGILDSQSSTGQNATVGTLNEIVKGLLQNVGNAYFVDLNLCLIRLGAAQFYDYRYWHIARAPFTRQALREIAMEDFKFVRALRGRARKCLVLDCDNTLWGGIVGEEGLAGIKLARTHPGSAFYEFQQEVVNLYHRGVIIALCSKNNEADVWEVFRKHPDMVLKEAHIATAQINWRDKATNLRQIAMDLNIGLDSLVFIDDSEFETALVRETLPEVSVIHIPPTKVMESKEILASCGLFDTLSLSPEDKKRGAMYKAETERKSLRTQAGDLEAYLRALDMVLEVCLADEFTIPRIAQLTQKTNQFNLTTKRYSEDEIRALARGKRSDVVYVRLTDRFGDSGIVGVCILKYDKARALCDTFLLSCRVLGRGVEDAFLIQVLKLARQRGAKIAIGEYRPTVKNGQVSDFYVKRGFEVVEQDEEKDPRMFEYVLSSSLESEPSHFKQIVSEIDS